LGIHSCCIAVAIGAILVVLALRYLIELALRRKMDLTSELGTMTDLKVDEPALRGIITERRTGWVMGRTIREIWVTTLWSGEFLALVLS
jgi:hypothetical protein